MILVSGATGLVGSTISSLLLANGQSICALKKPGSAIPDGLKPYANAIRWIEADIVDYYAIEDALEGITHVYHCAAMVSFDRAAEQTLMRVNVGGTKNMVDACLHRGIQKLLHVSSVVALGKTVNHEAITETTYWEYEGNKSTYALSKYESEMEVWRGIAEGLNALIINPSIIINETSSPQWLTLVGNYRNYYPTGATGFVSASDVAQCAIALMNSTFAGQRFIVNGENSAFRELLNTLATLQGLPVPTIALKKWQIWLRWQAHYWRNYCSRNPNKWPKNLANMLSETNYYANDKVKQALQYEFEPLASMLKTMLPHPPQNQC